MKIKVDRMSKIIRGATILDDIDLCLESGHIYGFRGVNGSGKTMLMRAICGLIRPTSGHVAIDGKVIGKDISFPPGVGVLIENPAFISKYTGYKNLMSLAMIQDIIGDPEIREMLTKVGLDPDDKRTYRKYSLGMKQRLGIAAAIMENPELILLDEPFNALDQKGIELVRGIILERKESGALIVLACHDRQELESLSDHIFEIYEGKITEYRNIAG